MHYEIIFVYKYFHIVTIADGNADYNIGRQSMHLIWSFGQVFPDYNHSPGSGIEAGTARNTMFYRPDEIKYHGFRNRGATTINFFGKNHLIMSLIDSQVSFPLR